jgi:hypothetical protein
VEVAGEGRIWMSIFWHWSSNIWAWVFSLLQLNSLGGGNKSE